MYNDRNKQLPIFTDHFSGPGEYAQEMARIFYYPNAASVNPA